MDNQLKSPDWVEQANGLYFDTIGDFVENFFTEKRWWKDA
jgi:hypothetical protein